MKGIRMLDLSCTKYPKDSNVISKSDTQQPPLKLAGYMHSLSFLHFGKDNTIQKYLQVRNASMAPLHDGLGIWKALSLGNDSREIMHFFVETS
jgi:hypothetical protein